MNSKDLIKKLKNAGTLSDQLPDMGYVSTGSLALNEVITGSYGGGVPIGGMSQIKGNSSTAKTVFLMCILREAQTKGYITCIDDTENALSKGFAKIFGIDPDALIYENSRYIEEAFECLERKIIAIRSLDPTTPIVWGLDSLAVLPTKREFEAKDYEQSPMDGAIRAKVTGGCLRKLHSFIRVQKVALIIINQIREKTGVGMYGNPETDAAGGRALEFYLSVDLKTDSSKTKPTKDKPEKGGLILDELDNVIGIKGKVTNKKNKVGVPFKSCEFRLFFEKGLDKFYGLFESLYKKGLIKKAYKEDGQVSQGWYIVGDTKFQKGTFLVSLFDEKKKDFDNIRNLLSFDLTEVEVVVG